MWLFSRDPLRDFPYELGPPEPEPDPDPDPAAPAPLWRLLKGRRKADGAPVSIFTHQLGTGDGGATPLARAALRRLRSLRHPDIVGYRDSTETERCLYLVTEPVTPLRCHLRLRPPRGDMGEQEVAWGLQRLLTALAFLGGSGLVHHSLGLDSIFVDPGGGWKLGGLELVTPSSEGVPPRPPGVPPKPQDPPELNDPSKRGGEPWAGDMWRLGCLIWEIFNGPLPHPGALRDCGQVPGGLLPSLWALVAADPSARPGPRELLERLQQPGAFITGPLPRAALLLQQLQVQDPPSRRGSLQELSTLLGSLPGPFLLGHLLPRLLETLELSADPSALPPLLQVAKALEPPEFQARIVPVLLRLFASPDRALRLQLLQQLEQFVQFLPPPTVEAQIFPHVALGFRDSNAALREHTVKSMVLLAPRLGEGLRGGQLLRLLLGVQGGDALGPLRCNATLVLGRLGALLPPETVRRVLPPALARATRDPFPPARAAAIAAFVATHGCYPPPQCAGGVLPTLCPLTVDPHPGVRQQAFRAIRGFLDQLEAAAESGGGPEGAPPSSAAAAGGSGGAAGGGSGGLGAAMSWAVTGVTSLTARLMGGEGGGSPPTGPPPSEGAPPEGPPPEGPPPPTKEPPPSEPPPPSDLDGWDEEWGSLEDMELPQSPPPSSSTEDGGAAPPPKPPSPTPPPPDPSPLSAPPPAGGDGEGEGDWGGDWGTEDDWEAPPTQRGPPPGRRLREQRRRDRGVPRGPAPPRPGPPKLGTRKRD